MYVPRHFELTDRAGIDQRLEEDSFAMLVTVIDGQPFATHLPLLAKRDGEQLILRGHVARANPHWKSFTAATLTIDVYGRVVGFTEADNFYYTEQVFSATSGQTSFSFTHTVGWILVFRNGDLLDPTEYRTGPFTPMARSGCWRRYQMSANCWMTSRQSSKQTRPSPGPLRERWTTRHCLR